jgi:hypothetical protein
MGARRSGIPPSAPYRITDIPVRSLAKPPLPPPFQEVAQHLPTVHRTRKTPRPRLYLRVVVSRIPFSVCLLALFLVAEIALHAGEPPRQWISPDGKSLIGSLQTATSEQVTLLVDGHLYTLPLTKLSKADQDHVRTWLEAHADAEPPSAPPPAPLAPWPKKYDGQTDTRFTVVREDPAAPAFIYDTHHYRFAFDVQLGAKHLGEIAAVFEGVSNALAALPVSAVHPQPERENERFPVVFFSDAADYRKAGAPIGSVGVFDSRQGQILIRLDALLSPPAPGRSALPRREQYRVLVHELTHQIMFPRSLRLPVWYGEGIAEYMSAAHFAPARFDFQSIAFQTRKYLKTYLPFADDGNLDLPSLPWVMGLDGRTWNEDNLRPSAEAFRKYATSLLLAHYFQHLDPPARDGRYLNAYLDALLGRQTARDAAERWLLRGRDLDAIAMEIRTYWDTQGLKIRFLSPSER